MSDQIALKAKTLKRNYNQKKRRPVRCVETGIIYASCSDASDILSENGVLINPRGILYVCQGRNKSASGLHWEYADVQ